MDMCVRDVYVDVCVIDVYVDMCIRDVYVDTRCRYGCMRTRCTLYVYVLDVNMSHNKWIINNKGIHAYN